MDQLEDSSSSISCITHSLLQHTSYVMESGRDALDEDVRHTGESPLGQVDYTPSTLVTYGGVYGSSRVLTHQCPHCGNTFLGSMEGVICGTFTN